MPATWISEEDLGRLQATALEDPARIRELLQRASAGGVELHGGFDRDLRRETATIETLHADSFVLRIDNLAVADRSQMFFSLRMDGGSYFFSARNLGDGPSDGRYRLSLPAAVYVAERRDRTRRPQGGDGPRRVRLRARGMEPAEATVVDFSGDGLAIELPAARCPLGNDVVVQGLDGPDTGQELFGTIHHRRPESSRPGWLRLGLSVSAAPAGPRLPVERRTRMLQRGRLHGLRRDLATWVGATVARGRRRLGARPRALLPIEVIEFENAEGQTLKAIIDAAGSTPGAPVVLMPPAFVKTKETLLPLARTIVESFRRAGERITVVRLDGINRRGESYKDPSCRQPGRECYRFTYSQGVRDIQASLDFLESSPAFQPSTVILVTFSSAAIEARRALALESRARIGGWVSVVGAADLASGWRVLNGGVDYLAGCERGVRFSIQPVLGVEGDVDHTARDAIASGLAYMEDARRDMAKIQVPILWLLGRDDGWIDAERAQELMACGDARDRRLIEVPTGHQLRTSREALDCFQLIAQEVATMVLSRPIEPTAPSVEDLLRRREAERSRLPRVDVDLPGFWKDYLLGREDRLGMELLTGTRVYRELMHAQVSGLDLRPGDRVADLGSGTGAFVRELLERDDVPPGLEVHQVDYVREALGRTRSRLGQLASEGKIALRFVACELGGASNVPLRSGSHHAILASLLINYVPDPHALLTECHRLLPSGGRLVLSALRPDPDISQILLSAIREVRSGAFELEAEESASSLERSLRGFLNDVARLVELEEAGVFQCWEADQLAGMVERSGFAVLDCQTSFGDPPQAIVLKAVKR